MRSKKEIYEAVLINWDLVYYKGICARLHFTCNNSERELMMNDFKLRKPKWYNSLFWWHSTFDGNFFWWEKTPRGDKQRKRFIKHIIKTLK